MESTNAMQKGNIMKGQISIIIPVYNGEKYLHRCLDSVINQSYQELEIIIVNDGSTDASLEICEKYQKKDKRIQIITKENGGVSSARNRGLDMIKTDWLLFLDADDEIPENAIEICCQILEKEPDIDFIAGSHQKITSKRVMHEEFSILPICSEEEISKCYAANVLYHLSYGTVWGKLFRSDLIRDHSLQFHEKLSHGEDCLFVFQYLQFSKYPYITEKEIYYYYVNDSSATKKFNENLPKCYCNALIELKRCISDGNLIGLKAYYHSCLLHLLLITVNYSFHKDNPASLRSQIREYKNLVHNPIFQRALIETDGHYLGMSKRYVLYMIRVGFYPGVYLCAKMRQWLRK